MSSIQSSIQDLESFKKVDTARALGIRQELDMYSQTALRLQPAQTEPLYGRDVIQGVPQPTKEVTSLNRDIFDKDIKSKEVRDDMESVAKMAEQTKNIREISKEESSGEAENAFIESIFGKGGLQILQESKKYAHDGNYTKTREMLQQFIHKYEKITNPDGVDIMQNVRKKIREVEAFVDVEKKKSPPPSPSSPPVVKNTNPLPGPPRTPGAAISAPNLKLSKKKEKKKKTQLKTQEKPEVNKSPFISAKVPGVYAIFKSGAVTYVGIGDKKELPVNLSDPLVKVEMVESGIVNIYSARRQKIHLMTTEGTEVKLRKIKIGIDAGISKSIDAQNMLLTSGGWLWEKNLVFECSYTQPKKASIKKRVLNFVGIVGNKPRVYGIGIMVLFFILCLYRLSTKSAGLNAAALLQF